MLTNDKIAAIALIMAFVACLLILPLQMINDIVFRQRELQPACSPRKLPAACSRTAITISRASWAAPPSSLRARCLGARVRKRRGLALCSLQRRARRPHSGCRSQTSSISRGLILFREVNGCIWTPEASTFSDTKTAGFNNQNRRKLHLKSVDASGVHFDSFTSRKSIRPRFRKALNVTKGPSLVTLFRAQGLHGILPGRAAGGQQAGNDRQ